MSPKWIYRFSDIHIVISIDFLAVLYKLTWVWNARDVKDQRTLEKEKVGGLTRTVSKCTTKQQ
jgi:hypothetical protein